MKVKEIVKVMNKYFDERGACEWDNSGLQIGSLEADCDKVLLCVDINDYTVSEALEKGANLIISHHPLFFAPIKNITDTPKGKLIKTVIKNDISLYSSHTCFDASPYGFNKNFCDALELSHTKYLEETALPGYGLGVVGNTQNGISYEKLGEKIKLLFGSKVLKVTPCNDFNVKRIAFCSGAGADFVGKAAFFGAEVLVTADCKNSSFLNAYESDIKIICPTHFESEHAFISIVNETVSGELPNVSFILSQAGDVEVYR